MILFQKIRWKNLLSTGNAWTEIDFLRSKTTMIMGENGAGKSTMLDALSFAIYGKPFRRINKPQLINSVNQKGTLVELEFQTGSKQYLIRRGLKPAKFEIIQNDRMINQTAKAKDYQDYLERDIVKMNHKSFTQIVILGSSTFVPFMQLPAGQRREVIEDLLDLQIFSRMNNLLKKKITDNKDEIRETEYKIELTHEKIKMQKKHLKEFHENNKAQIAKKREKISENRKSIEEYAKAANDLSEEIGNLEKDLNDKELHVKSKEMQYNGWEASFNNTVKSLKKKKKFFSENTNCPTCSQNIEEEFRQGILQETIEKQEKVDKALEELESKFETLKKKEKILRDIREKIRSKNAQLGDYNQTISVLQMNSSSLLKEIQESSEVEPETNIEELEKELEIFNQKRTDLRQLHSVYTTAGEMLKDSGIKSRIIKQYVPIMNKLINHYLQQLGFFVQFELDENFNETLKSRYLDVFSYDSFSEGEKLRIDLAILFTWRQIAKMRNSVSTNLLIMDEVFDSSLDVNGTDEFIKILEGLTNDSNTFIISHKSDQLIDKFDAVIRFAKKGNFSQMVE